MIALVVAMQLALAQGETVVVGFGNSSCATMMQPSYRDYRLAWVAGFFSGLNATSKQQVGVATDTLGLLGEVDNVCRADPSLALAKAAARAYGKLRSVGR